MLAGLVITVLLCAICSKADLGTFVHLTDVHHDIFYEVGSPTHCLLGSTGLGCCRADSIPLDPPGSASKWGDLNCDMSDYFLDHALGWIATNFGDADFFMVTGDFVDHHDVSYTVDNNIKNVAVFTELFMKHLPNSRVFPTLGNHDSFPIDQLYFLNSSLIGGIASYWEHWLNSMDPDAYRMFREYGYYTSELFSGVHIVALNSLWNDNNNVIVSIENDPGRQMEWLNSTLKKHRASGDKVWLLMHIFPGSGELQVNYTRIYQDLLTSYADTIAYSFGGHSHNDQFKLMRDKSLEVKSYCLITPCLEPHQQFPSIRRFIYDRETFEVVDYEQYTLNFTEQLHSDIFVGFDLSYVFTEQYDVPDMSLESMVKVSKSIASNRTVFDSYYNFYTPNQTLPSCDDACWKAYVCEINFADPDLFDRCISGSEGFNL